MRYVSLLPAQLNQPNILEIGPIWKQVEDELISAGVPLPLFHRSAWAEHNHRSRHRLLTVHDSRDRSHPSVAIQVDGSRILFRHRHLRVLRFGHGLPRSAWEPIIAALASLARIDARVLRLSVNIFSREHRGDIAALLAKHGFEKQAQSHSYQHTLTIDLRRNEDEILQGLHKTARKNLRSAEKSSLFVRPLTDGIYAGRIGQLQSASMSRTGGTYAKPDWNSILELSRLHPELSRVIGLFPSDTELHPDNLVGFGWGCMHGDHGEYRAAGTTRLPHLRLPLSYPLLWNLILWTKQQGASWFDLGGVTLDSSANDPLVGISDFKRYFSRTVEEVGEEWTLKPHPARYHLATLIGRGLRHSANVLNWATGERQASDA
jgi:hypothetical protein